MIRWPRFGSAGQQKTKRLGFGAVAGVIVLALVLTGLYAVARHSGPFQIVEGHFLDWRFQIRGPERPSDAIAIVIIDDRTLDEIGRWPFSRRWLADTLDVLRQAGARTIALDLLLAGSTEDDRPAVGTKPLVTAPNDAAGPDAIADDQLLADAIAKPPKAVVAYAFTFAPDATPSGALPEPIGRTALRIVQKSGDPGMVEPPEATGTLLPRERFLEAGTPAHVAVFYETDGKVRFAHPVVRYRETYYPSLPLEVARLYLGADRSAVAFRAGEAVSIGGHRHALESRQRLAINFLGPSASFPRYSLIDVASGRVDDAAFRDRIVLIGAAATGLGDRFATPFDAGLSGVELLANVTDNLLTSRLLRHDDLSVTLDLLAIALAAALTLALGLIQRPAAMLLAAVALAGGWAVITALAFAEFTLWLNFTFPLLALAGGTGIVTIGRNLRDRKLRFLAERQTQTLSHYVSPLTSVGLAGRAATPASPRDQTAAIMFVDLVGYTAASEQMPIEASTTLLQNFHELIEQLCSAHGGVVDKYIGDGAMLVFGIPTPDPLDAANAIRCAQALATAMSPTARQQPSGRSPPIACGCGIHYGTIQLVELGSRKHRQITVTGDTVNIASRLEALTRNWQAQLVVSGDVLAAARAAGQDDATIGFKRLPLDSVRGRREPIELWAWKITEP